NAFAIKRVIAQQLAGDPALNYDAANGAVVAPWLSWGPYLWADGLNARSDGLTWACSELNSSDGTHPSSTGRLKVADSLLAFVRRDPATAPWYATGVVGVPPPASAATGLTLAIAPNPAHATADVRLTAPAGVRWRLLIVDASGRRVGGTAGGRTPGVSAARAAGTVEDNALNRCQRISSREVQACSVIHASQFRLPPSP